MATSTATHQHIEIEGRTVRQHLATMLVELVCWWCGDHNGWIDHYAHVADGVCFKCNGRGSDWVTVEYLTKTFQRRDRDRARRQAKKDAKAARTAREVEEFLAANPQLAPLTDLDPDTDHHILVDLGRKMRQYGPLSPAQVALAERLITEQVQRAADRAQRDAELVPAPEGRQQVAGEVISVKVTETYYTYSGELSFRWTVRDDRGFLVNGTIPAAVVREVHAERDRTGQAEDLRGRRVTFTATLERGREEHFAFAKRPAKVTVAAPEPAAA